MFILFYSFKATNFQCHFQVYNAHILNIFHKISYFYYINLAILKIIRGFQSHEKLLQVI